MEKEVKRGIHPSAKKLWTINGLIASVFIMGISYVVSRFLDYRALIPGGLISIYISLIHPSLEYKQWSYRITDNYIDYTHGIIFKKRTIIPVSRIQHMDIKQGPIQKRFSLANIAIFTAGQAHEIEAVLHSEAQDIVDSINRLIMKEEKNGEL